MKVHYETVTKALDRVINDADARLRRIEKIELTPFEWSELQRELGVFIIPQDVFHTLHEYKGVRIEKGSFK